jgi:hypothetical protein
MTAQTAFRTGILLTAAVSILKIVGLSQISWWWLLWPLWLAIPGYIIVIIFIIVVAATKMGPPPF